MMSSAVLLALPVVAAEFPAAFDSRTQWPDCVSPVRDVGDSEFGPGCASEWAMSAAQTLQTNLCVLGKATPPLSAEEVGSCNEKVTNLLCNNWVIETAWYYINEHGAHSEECVPYTGQSLDGDACSVVRNASVTNSCTNTSATDEVYKCPVASSKWGDDGSDDGLKYAIMNGGAVQITVELMPELWTYTTGIYNPMPAAPERAELAVMLVGWGEDAGKFYWIAQNSWGSKWGMDGYFHVTNAANSNFIDVSSGIACIVNQTTVI